MIKRIKRLNKKLVIFVNVILIVALLLAYVFIYLTYGFSQNEKIARNVKESLINNVTNIQVVKYEWLDSKYKSIISQDEYENILKNNDYLILFEKLNSVKSKPNKFQNLSLYSTDFNKKEIIGTIVLTDGTTYSITHHIDFVSTLLFKPKVIRWVIDIEKINNWDPKKFWANWMQYIFIRHSVQTGEVSTY